MTPEERLIQRLITIYGPPKCEDPEAYIDEFERAVNGYPAHILDKAGNEVIKRKTFWPRPAEIVQTVEAILVAENGRKFKPPVVDDLPPPTPEQRARAKKILAMAMANMHVQGHREEAKPLPDMSRSSFETMQKVSPNRGLHQDPRALMRRITGERDD